LTPLVYRSAGSGEPVLFVHGWGLNSRVWLEQIKGFGGFRIIAVDLPGHGATPPCRKRLTISAAADSLCGLVRSLSLKKVHLVGWSLGAQVICHAALRMGFKTVRSLTMVSGAPCFAAKRGEECGTVSLTKARWTLRALEKDFTKTLTEFIKTSFYTKKELGAKTEQTLKSYFFDENFPPDKKSALELLTDFIETDMRPMLKKLKLPCLICHGDRDSILPVETVKVWEELLPSSRMEIFESCGHAPFITRSSRFNETLKNFLESL